MKPDPHAQYIAAMEEKDREIAELKDQKLNRHDEVMHWVEKCKGLETKLSRQDTEIAELKAKPKNTWCAYCGYEVDIDNDAASKISEHIQSCPSHPMRVWERHSEALEEQNKELQTKLSRLTALSSKQNQALERVVEQLVAYFENNWCGNLPRRIGLYDDFLLARDAINDYRADILKEVKND